MKIALCLHGLSHGNNCKGRKVRFDIGMYYIKKELLDKYGENLDVFVHTWNTEKKELIEEVYKPKLSVYEKSDKSKILKDVKNKGKFPLYSNTYSYYQCDVLRQKWEEENNIKYDCVIHTRFDVIIKINKPLEDYDMNFLYFPDNKGKMVDEKESGMVPTEIYKQKKWVIDYLFFGSSDIMKYFCEVYFHVDKILSKNGGINSHGVFGRYITTDEMKDKIKALNPDDFYIFFVTPAEAVAHDQMMKKYGKYLDL